MKPTHTIQHKVRWFYDWFSGNSYKLDDRQILYRHNGRLNARKPKVTRAMRTRKRKLAKAARQRNRR